MSDVRIHRIALYWKAKLLASNEYFDKREYENALMGYHNTLYWASVLNEYPSDCLRLRIPYMQVYIISCNNLSNTYCALGYLEEAENMLKQVVYYLVHLSGRPGVNIEELQRELKRAGAALLSFAWDNGGKEEQEKLFLTIKELLVKNRLIKPCND